MNEPHNKDKLDAWRKQIERSLPPMIYAPGAETPEQTAKRERDRAEGIEISAKLGYWAQELSEQAVPDQCSTNEPPTLFFGNRAYSPEDVERERANPESELAQALQRSEEYQTANPLPSLTAEQTAEMAARLKRRVRINKKKNRS